MGEINKTFTIMLIISQVIAAVMVVLVVVWTAQAMHGFAWDGSLHEFNLHPFCMVCGFTLFYAEAALCFRVFAVQEKRVVKIVHAVLHIIAFVGMVIGLQAVFDFHNFKHFTNMYTIHSWCGMITVLLFTLQYVFGFVTYLFPKLRTTFRQNYLPVHRYFGLILLFLVTMSSISGINEHLLLMLNAGKYAELPFVASLGNCLGLILIAFTVVVGFILHNPSWQRQENTEEQPLSIAYKPLSTDSERGHTSGK